MMKRYLLFGHQDHEASGGWRDFIAPFDNIFDAIREGKRRQALDPYDYNNRAQAVDDFHIVDLEKGDIVHDSTD